jgi:hypothetical protein
LKAAPSVDEAA